jgi:hypothetical protein
VALRDNLSRRLRAELDLTRPVYKNGPGRIVVYRNEGPKPAPDTTAALLWASGHAPEGWPEGLPLPLTAGEAIAAFDRSIGAMAEQIAADIRHAAKLLVKPDLVKAALLRKGLADRWPFSTPPFSKAERSRRDQTAAIGWLARSHLGGMAAAPPTIRNERTGIDGGTRAREWFRGWPAAAAPASVAAWARDALNTIRPGLGDELADNNDAGEIGALFVVDEDSAGEPRSIPAGGIALLFLMEQEIDRDRARPMVRWDAGFHAQQLLQGWVESRPGPLEAKADDRIVYLKVRDGEALQLALPLEGELNDPIIDAICRFAGAEGLRHWAALQEQLSEQGGSGRLRWSLDRHLAVLGYSKKEQTRTETRLGAATLVRLFSTAQLVEERTSPNGRRERESRPLLIPLSSVEALEDDDAWITSTIDFVINPLVYGGVRKSSGAIGSNWGPGPRGIAGLGHSQNQDATKLGCTLPGRFQRARVEDGRPWLGYTGASWLRVAGIDYRRKNPKRAWGRLNRALLTLQELGAVARWEWRTHPETLDGKLVVWNAEWLQDRTIGGVTPTERLTEPVHTGADLRAFRTRRGLTQEQVGSALGVSRITISRAERSGDKLLNRKLLDSIHRLH